MKNCSENIIFIFFFFFAKNQPSQAVKKYIFYFLDKNRSNFADLGPATPYSNLLLSKTNYKLWLICLHIRKVLRISFQTKKSLFDYLKNCLRGVFFKLSEKWRFLNESTKKLQNMLIFRMTRIYIHNNDYAKLFRNLYDYTASNGIFFETFHKVWFTSIRTSFYVKGCGWCKFP